jgi:hypothetical protein
MESMSDAMKSRHSMGNEPIQTTIGRTSEVGTEAQDVR